MVLLRACTAFTKDQSSVLRTHVKWYTMACNSNSSGTQETLRAPECAHIYTVTCTIANHKSGSVEGIVAYVFNPSNWEAKGGGAL